MHCPPLRLTRFPALFSIAPVLAQGAPLGGVSRGDLAVMRRGLAGEPGLRLGVTRHRRGGQTVCGTVRTGPGQDEAGWRMVLVVLESRTGLVAPPPAEDGRDRDGAIQVLDHLVKECG